MLTRPTSANKSFPYHIKTTQTVPMDNYPHHVENESGNVNFNNVTHTVTDLSSIFMTSSHQKYQITDEQSSVTFNWNFTQAYLV